MSDCYNLLWCVYKCACMCVYVHVCTCVCTFVHVSVCVCVCTCTCACISVHVCVYVHVCMCLCVYVCVHVCVCILCFTIYTNNYLQWSPHHPFNYFNTQHEHIQDMVIKKLLHHWCMGQNTHSEAPAYHQYNTSAHWIGSCDDDTP